MIKLFKIIILPSLLATLAAGCGNNGTTNPQAASTIETIFTAVDEPAGANCTYGGKKLMSGPDTNGNGVVEASEATSVAYVCNTSSGVKPLYSITEEPHSVNCGLGGLKVCIGLDSNANNELDADEVDSTTYLCVLGAGKSDLIADNIYDQSVNGASVTTTTSGVYNITTTNQVNAGGAFNKPISIGNKAILGIYGLTGRLLTEFNSFSFSTNSKTGGNNIYVNMIIDLDGDIETTTDRKVLVASDQSWATIVKSHTGGGATLAGVTTTYPGGEYDNRTYSSSDPIWVAVGGITKPAGCIIGDATVLENHLSATTRTFDNLNICYPNAIIVDAASGDNGMPKNVVTTGLMMISGDSNNTLNFAFEVRDLSIN